MREQFMGFEFLIYDKFPVIRKGLGIIVSKSNPNTKITYSESLDDFIVQIKESKFNLILADITSEKTDFFQIIDLLLPSLSSEKKIIVFTEESNGLFKERCSAISPNIFVMNKNSSEDAILEKINDCFLHVEISELISNLIVQKKTIKKASKIHNQILSVRELECVFLLLKGLSNIQIARKLLLSSTAVSTYKKRVLLKTQTNNIVELTRFFSRKNKYSPIFIKHNVFDKKVLKRFD